MDKALESDLIIALSQHGLTYNRYSRICNAFGSVHSGLDFIGLDKVWGWFGGQTDELIEQALLLRSTHEQHNIDITTICDSGYPSVFRTLSDAPLVLYSRGDTSLLSSTSQNLTVIGSRNHSKYAQILIEKILPEVVQKGIVLVSGLAEGVDGMVAQVSVDHSQPTIAVVGSGLDDDHFYPKSNVRLYHSIIEKGGLVVSEHPMGTKPLSFHFPRRNRLLAALSPNLWVVEASNHSGSMTTVKYAQEYGKTMFTCPTNLFVDHCSGNISLIQQEAKLIFDHTDILNEYSKVNGVLKEQSHSHQPSLFDFLIENPMHIDDIAHKLNKTHSEVLTELSMGELTGEVEHAGENIWVKK